jgi:TAG lipase / steryl ester hydrolase / phospholipase A2 / LPA acyltransferase
MGMGRRACERALKSATSYDEWHAAAASTDALGGEDSWRENPRSSHYDFLLIAEHLAAMREHRENHRLVELRALIEESLHRNLGDISNPLLYARSHVGTKRLIEDYLDEVNRTFMWLCDTPFDGLDDQAKLAQVRAAFKVFGRSALVLSGGGSLGLFHLGVIKALSSQGLIPSVMSGASMGAIVAAGVCTRTDDELAALFADPSTIHRKAVRVLLPWNALRSGSLLDPEQLREHVHANVGEFTFLEAYRRSGRVLNIAVSPTRHRQKPRLLNYMTSPEVVIASAVTASCSLPALFPPSHLMRRDDDGEIESYVRDEVWMDGSVAGDVPTMRLSRLHNVNHTIVSQANPHVVPFLKIEEHQGWLPMAVDILTSGPRAQARHALSLARRRLGKTLWRSPLEWAHSLTHQVYQGDINICPQHRLRDLTRLMANPSLEELEEYIRDGERATWPKLAMIRDATRVSRSMETCIRRLESRLRITGAGDEKVDSSLTAP